MHRAAAFIAVLLVALCAVAASASAVPRKPSRGVVAAPEPVFVLTGGGWGHGVGLSQWGAYGQAGKGRTFDQILATYYPGTQMGRSGRTTVRVLLEEGVSKVAVTASGPFRVIDATSARYLVRSGSLTLTATLEAPLADDGGEVALVPPVRVVPRTGFRLSVDGTERRGSLTIEQAEGAKGLRVVNPVPLESYLLAVVPAEMPFGWPLEALKAQAVAARTYALTRLAPEKPWDVYPDWRSQMYAGVAAETPGTTQAVRETAGRILTFDGAPAQTFYFSSSGGRTASALDIFGMDVPYLRAVADPWDETSPNHAWEPAAYTAARLAKTLGLAEPVADVTSVVSTAALEDAAGSGSTPERIRFLTVAGEALDLTRTEIRARLGLKSTAFRFGVLALSPPEEPPARGRPVMLRGVARGVERPVLEQLGEDGAWHVAKPLSPRRDGTFAAKVRPARTYRLAGSGQAGPTVSVAPVAAAAGP